jgi:hypothetical protein
LTEAYKNLFPITISPSILAMTTLRSNLSMYIFFVYNNIFFFHCLFHLQLTRGYFPNSPRKSNFSPHLHTGHFRFKEYSS